MGRFLAGVAACLLLVTGGLLLWQSRAEAPALPSAPLARFAAFATPGVRLAPIPNAPEADAKSKEEKRFARADKNKDGRITLAELVEPRRKAYDRLDLDHDGKLSFEEWAVKTIDKFKEADADKSQVLNAAEFTATAPKPKAKKPECGCG
ncbi:EF-hand domain-containing protein [Sphingomonas sp.]|uniref:EF-hand domain-containing protein n=1 Tax=Sphingomonas sp. TaxID=28214 RepID=UPI00286ABC85|nr:EF-hand domain-containing protein [Sphingomonas sp.]